MTVLKSNKVKLDVIRMDKEGYTSRQIAKELGCSKSTIGNFLRKELHVGWWNDYDAGKFLPHRVTDGDITVRDVYEEVKEGFDHLGKESPFGKDNGTEDNSRILFISDLHLPYNHKDVFDFLQALKDKYEPTRIICVGDEIDSHSLSFHDSDPDLAGANDELLAARKSISRLEGMFPEMDLVDSNHGSMIWRKAKHHGIPKAYIKSYNEVLGVSDGWKWHHDLTITLPNGQKCYVCHGKTNNVIRMSQQMGMNAVAGHYHEIFKIDYWANSTGLYWGLQTGCLIDDDSYAFSYNNVNLKRPIIGTAVVVDSKPILEPMVLDQNGDWIGYL